MITSERAVAAFPWDVKISSLAIALCRNDLTVVRRASKVTATRLYEPLSASAEWERNG
jgi:hypothetical protein